VPNIKSVKKDVIRSRQRNLRNQAVKSRIKTFVKKTKAAIEAGDAAVLTSVLQETVSIVDKAAKRGIIHKNAANRRKSRLMRRANAAAAGTTGAVAAA
jgi:small subunit ribosomal protein S20